MSSYNRMKRTFLQGLLWLYLLGFGYMALSLEPGFLDFDNLPDTNFTCVGKVIGGYYADLETNCQMFHVCTIGQMDEPMDIRFLCLNGTVFDQETRVCERIDEVDCTKSEQFYSLNLELYGNSQPSIVEENPETDQPLIIKSTTAKSPAKEASKTTHRPYYTTPSPPTATTAKGIVASQTTNSYHFPLINRNSPDIRFNPEEINISLHPGAPPDIRTKNAFQHHDFSDKKVASVSDRVVISTDRVQSTSTTQVGYDRPTPGDINFGFTYRRTESAEVYTDSPHEHDFHQYHREYRPSQKYSESIHNQPFKSSTFRNDYSHPTPQRDTYQQHSQTTLRNIFIQSLKPPALNQQSQYSQLRTERPPQRLQLPLPLLPTLPTLTFSTPTPFALQHHVETKRYTKDHFPPPRIIISASASVSDATGRRLNYSLGTIGAAQILQQPPTSYDEYKEEHVGLDPFYHDVPKVKHAKRKRRSTDEKVKHSDIIQNEQQAVDVLKFLFDWYRNEQTNPARSTTPVSSPLSSVSITEINRELAPVQLVKEYEVPEDSLDISLKTSELFNKNSEYSIVGTDDVTKAKTVNSHKESVGGSKDEIFQHEKDYVDDNYEPNNYDEKYVLEKKQIGNNNKIAKESVGRIAKTRPKDDSNDYTLPLDYVDDNIEPIYYSERSNKDATPNIKYNVDEHGDDETLLTEITTEKQFQYPSSQLETFTPSIESFTDTSNVPSIGSTVSLETTEKIIKSRKDRKRWRNHNNDETNTKDIDFKNIFIDKLIERPYRAKDDYDYLRTVSNVMSSTTNTDNLETDYFAPSNAPKDDYIVNNVTNIDKVTEDSIDPTNYSTDLIATTDSIEFATTTISEKLKHRSNRRRGRQKYNTDNTSRVSYRTRRPVHQEYITKEEPSATISEHTSKATSTNELLNDYKEITKYATYVNTATESTMINTQTDDLEITKYATYLDISTQPTVVETNIEVETTNTNLNKHNNFNDHTPIINLENFDMVGTPSYPPTETLHLEDMSPTIEITTPILDHGMVDNNDNNNTTLLPTTTQSGLGFKNEDMDPSTKLNVETTTDKLSTIIDEVETTMRSTMVGISKVGSTDKFETTETLEPFLEETSTQYYEENVEDNFHKYADKPDVETTTNVEFTTEMISTGQQHPDYAKQSTNIEMTDSTVNTTLSSIRDLTDDAREETYITNHVEHQTPPGINDPTTEQQSPRPTADSNNVAEIEQTEISQSIVDRDEEVNKTNDTKQPLTTETAVSTWSEEIKHGENDAIKETYLTKYVEQPNLTETTTDAITEYTTHGAGVGNDKDINVENVTVYSTEATSESSHSSHIDLDEFNESSVVTNETTIQTTAKIIDLEVVDATNPPTTAETTTRRRGRKNSRPTNRRTNHQRYRHRFSTTEQFTKRPQRKQTIEDEIIEILTKQSGESSTEPIKRKRVEKIRRKLIADNPTDAPLRKNASPTKAERASQSLPTTPLTHAGAKKHYFFNCFGKPLDKFYADPRDCRLFHYCTQGYTKNQLLDMKFVCDMNTYFDDETLICTKDKPRRCL